VTQDKEFRAALDRFSASFEEAIDRFTANILEALDRFHARIAETRVLMDENLAILGNIATKFPPRE
jgi:hypothetical protein